MSTNNNEREPGDVVPEKIEFPAPTDQQADEDASSDSTKVVPAKQSLQVCPNDPPVDAARIDVAEYEACDLGLIRIGRDKKGKKFGEQLTTFQATIVAEIISTDGFEEHRSYEIEASKDGITKSVIVSAAAFDTMRWVAEKLPPGWIITAGFQKVEHARAAIHTLSDNIRQVKVYQHTGWVKVNGEFGFVHAGGIIGGSGPISGPAEMPVAENRTDVTACSCNSLDGTVPIVPIPGKDIELRVELPGPLSGYRLPTPPTGDARIKAVRGAFDFLKLGPPHITMILFAAIWRSVIDRADFSIFLVGPTGNFKSYLAVIVAQFFGPEISVRDLIGWSSTANALMAICAHARHVLFPVDDFMPFGTDGDFARSNRAADQLLRSQANGAGRHRARGDGSLNEGKSLQGMILSTGEALPHGASLNNRFVAVEIEQDEILDAGDELKMNCINKVQQMAREGVFASAMAAYLASMAPRLDSLRCDLKSETKDRRDQLSEPGLHGRAVDNAANLLCGLDNFLYFAEEIGAIDNDETVLHWKTCVQVLIDHLIAQAHDSFSENPAHRFIELLASALTNGKIYFKVWPSELAKDRLGDFPEQWGYEIKTRTITTPKGDSTEIEYLVPRGEQVGWTTGSDYLVDPQQALAVVNAYARKIGVSPIQLGTKALGKRLYEAGFLIRTGADRNTVKLAIPGQLRIAVWDLVFGENSVYFHPPDLLDDDELALKTAEESLCLKVRTKKIDRRKEIQRRLVDLQTRRLLDDE